MGKVKTFEVFELDNYVDNPRHERSKNQRETMKNLFDSVGNNNMYHLAEDISSNGLMQNLRVVVVKNSVTGHYDVYDGNRRIAALKILLNPDAFDFLDTATLNRFKKLSESKKISSKVNCYVTDEKEAYDIMKHMHSGEDSGRGMKQWGSREKERFSALVTGKKSFTNLVDENVRKYFDDFDITTILNWTTINRIFHAKRIREKIGLDENDESTFTKENMQLLVDACKQVKKDADEHGIAPTRLYNKVVDSEARFIPWIDEYREQQSMKLTTAIKHEVDSKEAISGKKSTINTSSPKNEEKLIQTSGSNEDVDSDIIGHTDSNKKSKIHKEKSVISVPKYKENTPYFFEGLDNDNLDQNDQEAHGVIELCREIYLFSDKSRNLVIDFPIVAAFLVRSIIEQSIIYYSKNNYIQGQHKLIYSRISNDGKPLKLSSILKIYVKNINNFVEDENIRQYFKHLFEFNEKTIGPLNWVVHRPEDFIIQAKELENLPKTGLLRIINYFLNHSNKGDQ